jgi:hypothetical protein
MNPSEMTKFARKMLMLVVLVVSLAMVSFGNLKASAASDLDACLDYCDAQWTACSDNCAAQSTGHPFCQFICSREYRDCQFMCYSEYPF